MVQLRRQVFNQKIGPQAGLKIIQAWTIFPTPSTHLENCNLPKTLCMLKEGLGLFLENWNLPKHSRTALPKLFKNGLLGGQFLTP